MKTYSDSEAREQLKVSVSKLKKIRVLLRQRGIIKDREKLNDDTITYIKRVVDLQQSSGITYELAMDTINEERKIENLRLRLFEENSETFALDKFLLVLTDYYGENASEVLTKFLESFVEITDILKTIGDNNSCAILNNLQELIVSNSACKHLYQEEEKLKRL